MTKETMIRNYRKFAAHDAYIIGFVINGKQYITFIDELMPRWIYLTHESTSHGGGAKIKLYIPAKDRDRLLAKNSICLGDVKDLMPTALRKTNGNKGFALECLVSEYFGVPYTAPDRIGFWHDGDVTSNGVKYQVKNGNSASIVAERTLDFLKQYQRLGVTPPATFDATTSKQIVKLKKAKKNKKSDW